MKKKVFMIGVVLTDLPPLVVPHLKLELPA